MASDGTLEYDIRADEKGFTGPLGNANRMIGGLGRGIGGLIGPVGALVGVAGGLAGIGKALGGAADLEQMAISFEVLTGSMEKGKGLLEDVRKMGAETPYEFPALAEGVKTMLSFGIATEDTLPLIRMLGDIAGGSQDKLSSLSLVMGQVASAGRLTGSDLLQFINAGFNPLNEIAKRTGESMVELRKRMEDGGVGFAEVRQAMVDATSAGGMFFGMMDKQAGTTKGLLSTLKDEVNAIFTAAGTPINDALKPVLEGAIVRVGQFGAALNAAVRLAQAAVADGRAGELLGMALKLGAMEGVNYLVGGFEYSVKLLDRLIRFSFRNTVSFFTGEFTGAFQGIAKGLGLILLGIGDLIQSSLGTPFQKIVANFQAGLMFSLGKVMEGIGKIPILGEKRGLADFKGQSFSDLLSQAMGANDPAAVKAQGEASIEAGLGAITDGLGKSVDVLTSNFDKAFEGMDGFEAANVFDTSALRSNLGKLAQSVDPKAYGDFLGALKDLGSPLGDAVKKAAEEIAAPAANLGQATRSAKDGKIRLYGLEESEARRKGRRSEHDKARDAFGGSALDQFAASPKLADRIKSAPSALDAFAAATAAKRGGPLAAAAAGAPPAMAPPPPRGAAAATSRKTPEAGVLDLLKEIAGNTAPMKSLAAA
jgi:tape measure domain-containing protein